MNANLIALENILARELDARAKATTTAERASCDARVALVDDAVGAELRRIVAAF